MKTWWGAAGSTSPAATTEKTKSTETTTTTAAEKTKATTATAPTGQAPAGAPAGSTGLCNDGTYYSGATKSGACRGHKGVKDWWGGASAAAAPAATTPAKTTPAPATTPVAPATTPAPAATQSATPAPASSPATETTGTSTRTPLKDIPQAPGGGPGLVWLNTASNVYHCPGAEYYGKTKAGKYMTEAQAQAAGAHNEGGKPCK